MIAYYEQQQQNVTRIGEQTKGALGNIYEVILEDGSKISLPITLVVISEEGQRFEGIKSDIEEIKKEMMVY